MGRQWRYRIGGSELGPVTTSELRELARSGRLTAADAVQCNGGHWVPARKVDGLFPAPTETTGTGDRAGPEPDDLGRPAEVATAPNPSTEEPRGPTAGETDPPMAACVACGRCGPGKNYTVVSGAPWSSQRYAGQTRTALGGEAHVIEHSGGVRDIRQHCVPVCHLCVRRANRNLLLFECATVAVVVVLVVAVAYYTFFVSREEGDETVPIVHLIVQVMRVSLVLLPVAGMSLLVLYVLMWRDVIATTMPHPNRAKELAARLAAPHVFAVLRQEHGWLDSNTTVWSEKEFRDIRRSYQSQ